MTSAVLAQIPKELDAYIENARREAGAPGLAVTIVKDGRVVATKGYGVRELGKEAKVDDETMFDIASLTKSFTAAAIATLVDEGKMRWDDPVRRYLPAFELADPYRTQHATIRDLLAHRLGLEQGNFMFRFTNYDTAEVIRRMRYLEERAPFRSAFIYSNVGYTAAGEAAAAAAGMSFSDLVRTRLLEPLGMRDTTVGVEHTLAPNHASPHAIIDGVAQPIRNRKATNIFPANGVNSNARDMAKWLLFQLSDGKPIVSPRVNGGDARASDDHPHHRADARRARRPLFRRVRPGLAGHGLPRSPDALAQRRRGRHAGLHGRAARRPCRRGGDGQHVGRADAARRHRRAHSRHAPRHAEYARLGARSAAAAEPLRGAAGRSARRGHNALAPARCVRRHVRQPAPRRDGHRARRRQAHLQFGGGERAELRHWNYDTFRVIWRDRAYEAYDTYASFALDPHGTPVQMTMPLGRDTIVATR